MGGWYDGFVSWAQTVDWQAWGLFANAAAILTAAIVAKATFEDWKNQLLFRRKFKLAEKALITFDEAEAALNEVRNPMSFPYEEAEAKNAIKAENPSQRLITSYIVANRIADRSDKWKKLASMKAPIQVHFDKQTADALTTLLRAVHEVRTAANFYARGMGSAEFQARMEGKMWAGGQLVDDEVVDPIADKIALSRKTLDDTLLRFLRGG